jgi:hypothetical protein
MEPDYLMSFKRLSAALQLLPRQRTRYLLAFGLVIAGLGIILPGSGQTPPKLDATSAPIATPASPPATATPVRQYPVSIPVKPPQINVTFLPFVPLQPLVHVDQSGTSSSTSSQDETGSAFADYDFLPGSKPLTLRLTPPDQRINAGLPLEITFMPGEQCFFGDRQACIYQFTITGDQQIILASLHSGVGGEGQPLRHALEGTGFNRGLYSPRQVAENAQALAGARVSLLQGKKARDHFELLTVARIPPEHLVAYFAHPVEQTLDFAVAIGALEPSHLEGDILVLETCGWRLPGEPWAPGVSTTTGSVYLILISFSG